MIDIKRDDIIFRTASLYLDAERATQTNEFVTRQIQEFERIREVVSARVAEGKELEIENDKAMLNVARAKQRAASLSLDRDYFERSLAIVLGYGPEDAVKISTSERSVSDKSRSDCSSTTTSRPLPVLT